MTAASLCPLAVQIAAAAKRCAMGEGRGRGENLIADKTGEALGTAYCLLTDFVALAAQVDDSATDFLGMLNSLTNQN